ncbi:MAG TPA: 2-oxo-tetronate isomerase [Ramlibacter sp.]
MPQFAANLSMLYPELDFLDRFEAAARDGFRAVEFLFPYAYDARELKSRLSANGLQQVLINAPPGDWDKGEKGLACLPGREREFRESIAVALDYARVLECPRIHVMAGLAPDGASRDDLRVPYLRNLEFAAGAAAKQGIDCLIEPINTRDIPHFFLNRQDEAHAIVQEVGAANLKVQMDLYHCQIVEGDVAMKIQHYLPTGRVGHFQIAGVPQRHEPDVGELNCDYLFGVIDEVSAQCGWQGWVGCEYRPARGAVAGGTSAGLGWFTHRR